MKTKHKVFTEICELGDCCPHAYSLQYILWHNEEGSDGAVSYDRDIKIMGQTEYSSFTDLLAMLWDGYCTSQAGREHLLLIFSTKWKIHPGIFHELSMAKYLLWHQWLGVDSLFNVNLLLSHSTKSRFQTGFMTKTKGNLLEVWKMLLWSQNAILTVSDYFDYAHLLGHTIAQCRPCFMHAVSLCFYFQSSSAVLKGRGLER